MKSNARKQNVRELIIYVYISRNKKHHYGKTKLAKIYGTKEYAGKRTKNF